MKIAYNPKTATALTTAPANNDITFDLSGLNIFARGVKFKGTDTTYSVFKKHTSASGGGYNGLVPVPSYTTTNIRFLREDGTWKSIDSYLYTQITNQDLNTLKTEGKWYYAAGGNTTTNKPSGVYAYELYVGRNANGYRYLKLITSDGIIWFRYHNASTWTSWVRWYTDANTDYRVKQSASTTSNFRPLILGYNNSTDKSVLANDITNLVYTTTTIYAQPSSGTLYANKFIGKIDWSNIDGKPSCFTPCAHTHSSNLITTLTSYVKATSNSALSTSDSLNIALGKLEYKGDLGVTAYNLVNAAYDGDGTIENLKEILKVLEGIKDTETIKGLLGKYLPLAGGTMTGVLTLTSGVNSAIDKTALSFIKSTDKSELARIGTDNSNGLGLYAKGTIYIRPNITFDNVNSNGLVISSSSFTYNGIAVSLAGHTHDDRYYTETEVNNKLKAYLPLAGGTMTGTLTTVTTGTNSYNQGIRINRTATNQWATLLIGKSGTATSGTGTSTAGDGAWLIATPASSNSLIFNLNGASETAGLCLKGHGNTDMKWNNNTVWHAGNDGSGSGLDADTLDGNHSSSFALVGHNHDNKYVRRWFGEYGSANKFLKLVIGDEKGWVRLEVSDSNNNLTAGYGIYMIGWGYHGNNGTDTLSVRCLYTNNSQYITALKVVRISRNNYDFYFLFVSNASYPGYTITYSKSVTSIDCTVTAVTTIPTATWTSSLSALLLNASLVDWSGVTNKPKYAAGDAIGGSANYLRWESATSSSYARKIPISWADDVETTTTRFRAVYSNSLTYRTDTNTISSNISGNASSATKLLTARTIWGLSFNGTSNVNGTINISGTSGNYNQGIRIHTFTNSLLSSVWFRATNADGYQAGMWGISVDDNGMRFRGNTSKTATSDPIDYINILHGGNVGIGTTSPGYKLHVVGDIYTTTGFKKNGSSDSYVLLGGGGHKLISDFMLKTDELSNNLTTITKSLNVTLEWMDTGITSTNIPANGTYIVLVQVSANDGTGNMYYCYSSGVMSWYKDGTNDTETDEIILHRSGHAYGKIIYLRTVMQSSGVLKLLIGASSNIGLAYTYTFKFKRII